MGNECVYDLSTVIHYSDEQIRFFCYQVIENFVVNRYPVIADAVLKQNVRNIVMNIMQQSVCTLYQEACVYVPATKKCAPQLLKVLLDSLGSENHLILLTEM